MNKTTEELQANIAARDALIGELRGTLLRIYPDNHTHRISDAPIAEDVHALLGRTPADVKDELARLRKELKESQGFNDLANENTGRLLEKCDAMRAKLASAEADKITAEGMINRLNGALEQEEQRAEAAEALAKDLGKKYNEWARLYAEQGTRVTELQGECDRLAKREAELTFEREKAEARLRSVTDAGDAMKTVLLKTKNTPFAVWISNGNGTEPERAIARWDAARSADLPSAKPENRPHICALNRALSGECFVCGSVDEKIAAAQREADERHAKAKPVNLPSATVLFRAACSGLWYSNPKAAGTVNAVKVDGKVYEIEGPEPADLPPHPDTERLLKACETLRDAKWTMDFQNSEISWDEWTCIWREFRAAIDAARAQAGKEAS